MIPSRILKVLSTLANHNVRYLLMGGQACVLYGAADFSRDIDLTILSEPSNLESLSKAVAELQAQPIAVPPCDWDYLNRGHAIHFRSIHPDIVNLRIDIMARMRGVAPFEELWDRRTTMIINGLQIELLDIGDLVKAKKTQRDKDWPMIRRLVEVHYSRNRANPTPRSVDFWLAESRTPKMLADLAQQYPAECANLLPIRPLLALAIGTDLDALSAALDDEENCERRADAEYWRPLRKELEQLRHSMREQGTSP